MRVQVRPGIVSCRIVASHHLNEQIFGKIVDAPVAIDGANPMKAQVSEEVV